jgi:predicted MFS family arabinose efflux permease
MAWMTTQLGWREAFVWLAVVTFVVAALILFVVPERDGAAAAKPAPLATQLREVADIYRDPVFLALAPVLAIPAGSHIALQTLWAGPWLRDIVGLDRTAVSEHLFVMGLAFLAGILLSGLVADWLTRRGVSLLTVNIGFLTAFLVSQVAIIFENSFAPPLLSWSVFVMTGSTAVLAYPWLASYFGVALSGRSNTAVNLLMFGMAFLVQAAVGWVIDLYPKSAAGGYAPEAYRVAFAIVLGLQVVALIWYLANSRLLTEAERQMKLGRSPKAS